MPVQPEELFQIIVLHCWSLFEKIASDEKKNCDKSGTKEIGEETRIAVLPLFDITTFYEGAEDRQEVQVRISKLLIIE